MERLTLAAKGVTRLVLTGFMGSGKTTVGRTLAQRLGWAFADLDHHVALREGSDVPALIADRGEAAFRVAEAAALADLLLRSEIIVALGGGAPETLAVQTMLLGTAHTVVVHLEAPFELLYTRCLVQAQDPRTIARPLLGDQGSAAERYRRRLPLYRMVAPVSVDAGAGTPEAVTEAVLLAVKGNFTS